MQLSQDVTDSISFLLDGFTEDPEWYRNYMSRNSPRIVADADFVSKWISPDMSVLDIGAVPPLLIELLRRRGMNDLTITDPQPETFGKYFTESGVRALKLDVLKGAPDELRERFDLVCMNEVVEHLAGNLLDAIQNAVDCVRPGGYLMVTTPNLRSIWGLYALIRKHSGLASKPGESVRAQYDRASAQFGYYGHVREYTKREVVALFRSFGLTLHAYEFQGRYQPLGKISGLLGLLEKIFPEWRLFGKYIFKKTD